MAKIDSFSINDLRDMLSRTIEIAYENYQTSRDINVVNTKLCNAIYYFENYAISTWNMNLQIKTEASRMHQKANVDDRILNPKNQDWRSRQLSWTIYLNDGRYNHDVQLEIINFLKSDPGYIPIFAEAFEKRKTITQLQPKRNQNEAEDKLAKALQECEPWVAWIFENIDSPAGTKVLGLKAVEIENAVSIINQQRQIPWSLDQLQYALNLYKIQKTLDIQNPWTETVKQIQAQTYDKTTHLDI